MNAMNYAFLCTAPAPSNGLRTAVVGAGPAGLSAAGWLACAGYEVHVYDKLPKAGGLQVFGIPGFRIPAGRIEEAAEKLSQDCGVRFHFCTKICAQDKICESGDEFVHEMVSLSELLHDCAAVLICTGSWRSRKLNIPGEDLPGVYTALEFLFPLRACKLAQAQSQQIAAPQVEGRSVAIIGAGLSAVDVAQSCLRLGARRVTMLYRRTVSEAPAGRMEIKLLSQRGVHWVERATPIRILGEDQVQTLVYSQTEAPGELELKADLVVSAIGEVPTNPFPRELRIEDMGQEGSRWIQMTKFEGVFVAGDVLTGPSKIGKAILSGLRAAESLDGWIKANRLPGAGQGVTDEEALHA